ncbi:hypothetical protein MACJ_002517 [Theileria orientalis]|uniref:Uncharacterized protein n=1 Tax=Theileria orientalis TaxID=68886 RepID=A0A976M6E3_THEOR|nr:hypothetical protein MACJ_002517 [Theileria orientalis]
MILKANMAPTKTMDVFDVLMKVDLDLGSLPIPQIIEVFYPAVYETNIFTARRLEEAFFVIDGVKYNNMIIYPGAPSLLNRNVYYVKPRQGLHFVHVASFYLDQHSKMENLEFYKTDTMEGFVENITKLISIDINDMNQLPLTLETRYDGNKKTDVFVSDLFKHYIKIGAIKYKDHVIDEFVNNALYRSFSCKYEEDEKMTVKVLSFMSNGKRSDVEYEINPKAENEKEIVKLVGKKVYYLGRM